MPETLPARTHSRSLLKRDPFRIVSTCRICDNEILGNRKFCSSECRRTAHESKSADPTPDEIREMCRIIREEGGATWERTRNCYPAVPYRLPVLTARVDHRLLPE